MLLEILIILLIISFFVCALTLFVYGSFRSGRQMGGVYMLYAPPGEGKSFVATDIILDYLRSKREVFSNYPVVSPDMKYQSKVWKKEFMKEQIQGAAIFIDESYKDFNSREYKTFSKDDHDWFATSGHNENSIWLLTQNPQRIDTVIREVVNFYVFVEKKEIPILNIPLFFILSYYRSEEDMKVSKYGFAEPWDTQRIWFNWYTASSYDTKFFKKPFDKPFTGEFWIKALEKKGFHYKPPIPTGIAFLKMTLNRKIDETISVVMAKVDWLSEEIGKRFDRSLEKEEEKENLLDASGGAPTGASSESQINEDWDWQDLENARIENEELNKQAYEDDKETGCK